MSECDYAAVLREERSLLSSGAPVSQSTFVKLEESADEIERKQQRIEELEGALREVPGFCNWCATRIEDYQARWARLGPLVDFCSEDCFNADVESTRAALNQTEEGTDG